MSLNFQDGQSFATGAIKYFYRPATVGETTNRITLLSFLIYIKLDRSKFCNIHFSEFHVSFSKSLYSILYNLLVHL